MSAKRVVLNRPSVLPVHREGGSAAWAGWLGEEHLQWDGGGAGPGSS